MSYGKRNWPVEMTAPATGGSAGSPADVLGQLSVVIPCHNAGGWLALALDSCWTVGVPHSNVILIDDGSSDAAVDDCLARWPDMQVLRNLSATGVAQARQRGLLAASKRWTLFLDQDDYLLPGLLRALGAADRLSDVAVVGNFDIDQSGTVRRNRLWFSRATVWREPLLDLMYENVQIGRWIMPTRIAQQNSFSADVGVGDDLAFVSELAAGCSVFAVPDVVLGYRLHPEQTSLRPSHLLSGAQEDVLRARVEASARRRHGRSRVLARRASAAIYRRSVRRHSGARRALLACAACMCDPTMLRSRFSAKVLLLPLARALRHP